MNKPYTLVWTMYCGMIGVDCEISKHATTKAAFRALHKLKKQNPALHLKVVNERGNELLEIQQKINGRWVTM